MTTLHLNDIVPQAFSKLFWIRVNRVLAWALLVSPALQWAVGMRIQTGLLIDLAILIGHAGLSLALFGKPETRSRVFDVGMHVLGYRAPDMSERNRFLLSGYRIAMASVALGLCFTPFSMLAFVACLTMLYPILRLSATIAQHIWGAVNYAMRRWGKREWEDEVAVAVVIAYFFLSIVNLVK